ncbi:MAG: Lpg1974 family pore-forming outer membrane protein [Waddliaceae bacterium]
MDRKHDKVDMRIEKLEKKVEIQQVNVRIFLAVLCGCLFLCSINEARVCRYRSSYCDPCSGWDPCMLGNFEVGGEFLLWRPCLDHLTFGIVNNNMNRSDRKVIYKTLCPGWEAGGRVWIEKPFIFHSHDALCASWMVIYSSDSASCSTKKEETRSTTTPLLVSPALAFRRLGARWRATYNDYDVIYSFCCSCGNGRFFQPFFGFAGLVFEQNVHVKGECLADDDFQRAAIDWKADLCAYGIRVGVDYSCQLTSRWHLFAHCATTVLSGKPHISNTQLLQGSEGVPNKTTNISHNICSCMYPGYHLAVGFGYHFCLCGAPVSFRLGYESLQWNNLPHPRQFLTATKMVNTTDSSGSTRGAFGWKGLLLGLTFYF